jgi:nucleoside phosphorylase
MSHKADILIVTVTEVESLAAIQAFEQKTGVKAIPQSIEEHVYFDLGIIDKARVFLTRSEMGSGGLGASLLTVVEGIKILSPTAVIMVGIAFGIDK